MMKTYSALKVAFAAGGMALLMTSCGITGGSNGDEKAAMSCMQDIATGLDSANIVEVGLIDGTIITAEADLSDVRKRAILAAEASAADSYWQPLADAWALNEALLQAILDMENTGLTGDYENFIKNVNLQYAAVSKDTYCRIAFSKQGVVISYESDSK
jgi:hypothetical protein